MEQHVHNIDVCNWVMKDEHPVQANGMGGRQVREKSNMYDHHFVEYTYADGTKMYSQCRQIAGCWNPVTEYAHGTKGIRELGSNGSDGYVTEHADLVTAIKSGAKLNDGWHGANSTMTAILGRMATHSGMIVEWDQAVKSDETLGLKVLALDAKPPITVGENGLYPVDIPGIYRPYEGVESARQETPSHTISQKEAITLCMRVNRTRRCLVPCGTETTSVIATGLVPVVERLTTTVDLGHLDGESD